MGQENFTKVGSAQSCCCFGFSLGNKERRPFWMKKILIAGETRDFWKGREMCCMISQEKPGMKSSKNMQNFVYFA